MENIWNIPPGTFNNGRTPIEKKKDILIYKNASMKLLEKIQYMENIWNIPPGTFNNGPTPTGLLTGVSSVRRLHQVFNLYKRNRYDKVSYESK